MATNAYERGARAKLRGKLLERNPFARRAQTRSNIQKANDWALGWHSVEARATVPSDWTWPPLKPFPKPQAGDYDRRESGLWAMMRPCDLLEFDVLRAEMYVGSTAYVPGWARIPYTILWHYADAVRNESLGENPDQIGAPTAGHPCLYLYSALRIQGPGSWWPPLIISAYEELMNGTIPEVLRRADNDEEAD